ncbi:hypothetical protein TRFO_13599 [Tritrichomonas foetus]|uniref:UBR-type domain-containing protein n=1 Tax=Tritrichomonas foetus TaxID=1144522 RepID=A0A1J4L1W0_9EUKA|nr:hypothetical protein TRFO_13599 [Tritrichomonas foetus]|eukprot:OHT15934.1 hypothetical protein TRFO_13599 [Tritrichomonas foetus]
MDLLILARAGKTPISENSNIDIKSLESILYYFGQLDVDNISNEDFPNVIQYWSNVASSIRSFFAFGREFNIRLIQHIFYLCRTAILLTKKSFERKEDNIDPILHLSGLSSSIKTVESCPIFNLHQTELNSKSYFHFVNVCHHKFHMQLVATQIIDWSLLFAMAELDFNEDTMLFDELLSKVGFITNKSENELLEIVNFTTIDNLISLIQKNHLKADSINYFISRFLYESLFSIPLPQLYSKNDFFQKIANENFSSDIEQILLITFSYFDGDKVEFIPEKFNDKENFFCLLCLRHLLVKDDFDTFLSKFSIEINPWIFIYYVYYLNTTDPTFVCRFLDYIHCNILNVNSDSNNENEKVINSEWKNSIKFLESFSEIAIPKNELISRSLNGDIKAAYQLLAFPEFKSQLQHDQSLLHKFAYLYFSDNFSNDMLNEIFNDISCEILAPVLFLLRERKKYPSESDLEKIFQNICLSFKEKLTNITQDHPIFEHCIEIGYRPSSINVTNPIYMPFTYDDFINADSSNPFSNLNFILYQLLLIMLDFKFVPKLDSIISLSRHYYLSTVNYCLIQQLFSHSFPEKVLEFVQNHLDYIFNDASPDRVEAINTITPLLKQKEFLQLSIKYILKLLHDGDVIVKELFISLFTPSLLNEIVTNVSEEQIGEMILSLVKFDQMKYAIDILNRIGKDSPLIPDVIVKISLFSPYSSSTILESLNNSASYANSIISLIKDVPKTVSQEYLQFILSLTSLITPINYSYEKIIKTKHIPITWEEDFISQSTEMLTKTFINIWEYPKNMENYKCTFNNDINDVQPCFYCYTCGIVDRFSLCLGCAMTCHRGHDLIYVRDCKFKCDCYRIPHMCIHNVHQVSLRSEEELNVPDLENAIQQFQSMLESNSQISFDQHHFFSTIITGERPPEIRVVGPYNDHNDNDNNNFDQSNHANGDGEDDEGVDDDDDDIIVEDIDEDHYEGRAVINNYNLDFIINSIINLEAHNNLEDIDNDLSLFSHFIRPSENHSPLQNNTHNSNTNNSNSKSHASNNVSIDQSSLLNLFMKLSSVEVETKKAVCFNEIDVKTIVLNKQRITKVDKALDTMTLNSTSLFVDSENIPLAFIAQDGIAQLIQRGFIAPLDIAAFVSEDLLIIGNTNVLSTYRLPTYEKISSLKFSVPINQIIPNPNDRNTLAITLSSYVSVISVDNTGKANIICNELHIQNSNFIIGSLWIESEISTLAVILYNQIVIFDLLELKNGEKSIPYLVFTTNDSEVIRSATFIQNNNTPYIVTTFDSGKYFIGNCSKQNDYPNENVMPVINQVADPSEQQQQQQQQNEVRNNGGIGNQNRVVYNTNTKVVKISSYKRFSWFPNQPLVSYCASSDLLFVSASGFDIACIRKSELFSDNPHAFFVKTFDVPGNLAFISIHPHNPALHIFMHSMSGGIATVEFKPSEVIFSGNYSRFDSVRFPILPKNQIPLAVFPGPKGMYSISSNGNLNELRISKSGNKSKRDKNSLSNKNLNSYNSQPFIPPPIFWTESHKTEENILVSAPEFKDDIRQILTDTKVIIDNKIKNKIIEVKCESNEYFIVGFKILVGSNGASHRPPYLKLCGREVKVTRQRWYHLPLRQEEIGLGKAYQIELGSKGGLDINVDGLNVFVIEKYKIPDLQEPENNINWLDEAISIFSFDDNFSGISEEEEEENSFEFPIGCECENKIDGKIDVQSRKMKFTFEGNDLYKILDQLSRGFKFDNINDSIFHELIRMMYTHKYASVPARRIFLRASNKNEEKALKIWTDEMINILKNKQIVKELWSLFLRDYSLLPPEYKSQVSELLWDCQPPTNDSFAFFSAFLQ